ncbi:hypothetical protein LIA77_11099 [Sarocladium implicatum]|nr:hypothetical protein LIA77_11099 [Sarocladium implicatum]
MVGQEDDLTHEEIWDDSALIDSWNDALAEYKKYHSIQAKGGSLKDLEAAELLKSKAQKETVTKEAVQPGVSSQVAAGGREDISNGPASAPPMAPIQMMLGSVKDESLKKLLMSWYYAGYYTGLITSSASFKIMVGPDRHEHSMHSALLASQSPVLRALVDNGMKESTERLVEWEHVAEHTFGHFSEFAYTRDFHVNRPNDGSDGSDVAEAVHPDSEVTVTSWLIHHTEVMIFAECYAVDDLLVLAHSKLDIALTSLPINGVEPRSSQAARTISDLCRFSYSRQVPVLVSDLILSFLEKHASRLWRDDTFQLVVKESPPLALDLLDCVFHQQPEDHRSVRVGTQNYSHHIDDTDWF